MAEFAIKWQKKSETVIFSVTGVLYIENTVINSSANSLMCT